SVLEPRMGRGGTGVAETASRSPPRGGGMSRCALERARREKVNPDPVSPPPAESPPPSKTPRIVRRPRGRVAEKKGASREGETRRRISWLPSDDATRKARFLSIPSGTVAAVSVPRATMVEWVSGKATSCRRKRAPTEVH